MAGAVGCGDEGTPAQDYDPGYQPVLPVLPADASVDSGWSSYPWPDAALAWPDAATVDDAGLDGGALNGSSDASASDASSGDAIGDASSTDASTSDGSVDDGGATPGSGAGLEGTPYTPFPTNGQPLAAADGKWTYFEFPDAYCRDGSKAGINVFRNSASKKLMFFFEGGGACFNSFSCSANPKAVDDADREGPTGGLFDRSNALNPVKDWNVVYVPYCTGDVFAGTKENGSVPGVEGTQKFVGYLNTQKFLQRIVPTFSDATDVLVTGVSAGGFGASSSVVLIQRAFPDVKGKLIDDSGPPMSNKVITTCLQKLWRETWGLDESMLKDCGSGCPNKDDFTFDYGVHLSNVFKNRLSGLIETTGDSVIRGFFGLGQNNWFGEACKGDFFLTPISEPNFKAGLLEFRAAVKDNTSFGTFFPAGNQHTWLMGDSLYSAPAVEGTKLIDWVSNIINDKGTKHVGQ